MAEALIVAKALAEGAVSAGLIDPQTTPDAKLIASAIREAGLRIEIQLREARSH